ncbi:hypothetical protein [Tuberibacillus sp. Marseille-P3662]|uniref:hypothetical protein n=1 Tax=Tuberibacillus sp. Marseille-P3662 TaxID=1965358 RepID=UPI000A1CBDF7|nr:hypothetical protein [Tuberibacillus sp. Marseille-P3662]
MQAFWGQLKKDFYLGRSMIIITIIGLIVLFMVGQFLELYFNIERLVTGLWAMIIAPHIFYLWAYMAVSLNVETNKFHLWLHTPLSGFQLLISKFINGLVAMVISFAIACSVFLWMSFQELNQAILLQYGFILAVHLFLFAIYIAIWFIFYWTIFQYFKKKIGSFAWLIIIGLFIAISWGMGKLRSSALYDTLTTWGSMTSQKAMENLVDSNIGALSFQVQPNGELTVYAGFYIFYLILCVILIWFSSWLLDKKIEV